MRSARSNTVTGWPARASCCAQASPAGPEPTTATVLPVRRSADLRRRPSPRPQGVVDDVLLDVLDRDRIVVDVEHARLLARRRADAAGELREVVRRVQALDRLAPAVAVHEVVPVGDDVPERAALVAERDAAIHAARALRRAAAPRAVFSSNSRQCLRRSGDRPPCADLSRSNSRNPVILPMRTSVRPLRGARRRCRGAASPAPWRTRPASP